jgi:aldehyde dehydrogenase (NAD+)
MTSGAFAEQGAPDSPAAALPGTFSDERIVALVQRLRRSFVAGVTRPVEWRLQQLGKLQAMVDENEDALFDALKSDIGRCRFESFVAETSFLRGEIKHALNNLRRWLKPKRVRAPMPLQPAKAMIYREPLGVVLIIAPWNYPIQLALAPLVGAIAAGNCAVIKPGEVAAASSELLARLVPKYLDSDCFAVVEGGVRETTTLLAQRFDHLFYTGNGVVGRIVMQAAAKHLTPVTLELGGKSPCIVDEDVDLDVAAKRIAWGKFFNAGQTCIAPDYVLVHRSVEGRLLDKLSQTIKEFYGEDPKQSQDFARIINDRHVARLKQLLDSGEKVTGGQVDEEERYVAPTVLTKVDPKAAVMDEEIFGPILPVLPVDGIDQAIEFVNQREKPLALYVFTKNKESAERVLQRTSSGGVSVNDIAAHFMPHELPFGGVGPSGIGAYHGRASFETFSHKKSVVDKATYVDPALRYPPYDDNKYKWVRRLT